MRTQNVVIVVSLALIVGGLFGWSIHARNTEENPAAAFEASFKALKRERELDHKRIAITTRNVSVDGQLAQVIDQAKCVERDAFILQ